MRCIYLNLFTSGPWPPIPRRTPDYSKHFEHHVLALLISKKSGLVQGVTNNSVFEQYSNSRTEQQYSYSVLFFGGPQIVFGSSNSWSKYLSKQFHDFPEQNVLYKTIILVLNTFYQIFVQQLGIQYLVFKQSDRILLFTFGIQIFLIPNSIRYFVFGVFGNTNNIRYSYSVLKSIPHTLGWSLF